jgi:hypothetical protein
LFVAENGTCKEAPKMDCTSNHIFESLKL